MHFGYEMNFKFTTDMDNGIPWCLIIENMDSGQRLLIVLKTG